MILTDYSGKKERANVGAVTLHTSFDKTAAVNTSSFNVARIEREGAGSYWVYFTNPAAFTTYQVALGTSRPLEFAYCDIVEKNRFKIKIVKTGTDTPVEPTGKISVICTGGDY